MMLFSNMFGNVEDAFNKNVVNTGVKVIEKIEQYTQKNSHEYSDIQRRGMRQLAYEICPFIPMDQKERYTEWVQTGDLLESYASKQNTRFPTEEQLLAEQIYLKWITLELDIRESITDPEQRVSFEEISLLMKQHVDQLITYIIEACTTQYIDQDVIHTLLDEIDNNESNQ